MLIQSGRPVPFGYLLFLVGGSALLVTLLLTRPPTAVSAIVCGLAFSAPIAAFCWILPTFDSSFDRLKEELRVEGLATIVSSILLMLLARFHRRMSKPMHDENNNQRDSEQKREL